MGDNDEDSGGRCHRSILHTLHREDAENEQRERSTSQR